ncbi:hypothetical protein LguiA_011916 [Lonicera macranthoides]
MLSSKVLVKKFQEQQQWSYQESTKQDCLSSDCTMVNPKNNYGQGLLSIREHKRSEDDGYNWRKYGQKQVKGRENPWSYTEIVYKGNHNHPKPHSTRSSLLPASLQVYNLTTIEPENSCCLHDNATPENSCISIGDDDFDSRVSKLGGNELDDDEPVAKRWRREGEGILGGGKRNVRKGRVVIQTTSDIDVLDDGYWWRTQPPSSSRSGSHSLKPFWGSGTTGLAMPIRPSTTTPHHMTNPIHGIVRPLPNEGHQRAIHTGDAAECWEFRVFWFGNSMGSSYMNESLNTEFVLL